MSAEFYQAKARYQSSKVAEDYDKERFASWWGKIANKTETEAFRHALNEYCKESGSVLDLPCGTGRLLGALLEKGFAVTAGDISEEMLALSKERFKNESKITFLKTDAERLPFQSSNFDYLTSYRFMCHLPKTVQQSVISEMLRVTRKTIILNYHFDSLAPLALFNRAFRKFCLPVDPFSEKELCSEIEKRGGEVLNISRLSWYERSSALVVIRKK